MWRFFLVVAGLVFGIACGSNQRASENAASGARPVPMAESTSLAVHTVDATPRNHGGAPVPVTGADPQWGDALAPVTIVEFSDFQCPFCARVNPTLEQIKRTYGPSQVRVVWKHNPLPFHENARPTADAAHTVFGLGGSDAFWKFHDLALLNQLDLSPENCERWALKAGVDLVNFEQSLAAKRFTGKVDDDMALAQKIGATGTPAFRINGIVLNGAQSFEDFQRVIDGELAEAKKLVDSGTKREEVYSLRTMLNFKEPETTNEVATNEVLDEDLGIWRIPVLRDDPVRGPADALVTIVEISDFECPFCKRVQPTLDDVLSSHPKDVRLVWKDNPLPFHQRARPAAVMARAAFEKHGNEAFWKIHNRLFASQPKLEDADLRIVAESAGLAWNPFALAIKKDRAPKIDQSQELAIDYQAGGTPHFFINGVRLAGAHPREKFEERIAAALEVANAILARGVPRSKVYDEIMKVARLPDPPERKVVPAPDATTPFLGDASAPVVIQEFGDFQCPYCKRVMPTLAELRATYGSKVKIVWRHLPLGFHNDAFLAAEATEEAFAQKGNIGFWRFHDELFAAQETGIGRDVLESIASRSGLDVRRFRDALDSHEHRAKVDADIAIAQAAGIDGTPNFVINGYFVAGAQATPAFRKVIKRALEERVK